MTFHMTADEALSCGLFVLTLAFILYAVWNSDTKEDLREAQGDIIRLERNSRKTSVELRELHEEVETLETKIKRADVRLMGVDPREFQRDMAALRQQVEAITEHLRPTPDNCQHIWELLDHQGHISRFKCLACRQTTDIEPTEQLKKLRKETN